MTHFRNISDIRREYGELTLDERTLPQDPFEQFKHWFDEVLATEKNDPTAMILSTVDENQHPDSRVVLLKGIEHGAFVFYTNYKSCKARQLEATPFAALNFYWPQMARQVRIRGPVTKVDTATSDAYFASRPRTSQLSAIASHQSHEVSSRDELEATLNQLIQQYGQEPVLRPEFWGGYQVTPETIEFWQGRDNRLHDRIEYYRVKNQWEHRRLAP